MKLRYIIILFCIAIGISRFIEWKNIQVNENYLSQFQKIPHLNTYEFTLPKENSGGLVGDHAVLLLHGYMGSTKEYDSLMSKLKEAKIPFYSPQLTGFGIGDFHLLDVVEASDWLRDSINAYDQLAAFYKKVSVVGHSNGGVLAVFVAQNRPVDHLILLAPNFFPNHSDRIYKELLQTPFISQIITFFYPVIQTPKREGRKINTDTCDPEGSANDFFYQTTTIKSLQALWQVQDIVDIKKVHAENIALMYGKLDQTVDTDDTLTMLNDKQIKYQKFEYDRSCHNLLDDYEKNNVIDDIIKLLQKP